MAVCLGEEGEARGASGPALEPRCQSTLPGKKSQDRQVGRGSACAPVPWKGGFQAESSCLKLAENGNPLGERTGRTKFRPSQREGAGSRNFWDRGAQTEP